ncbi:MAG TPA: hypothetical protein VH134_05475 [Candidatus Dormibacteraeota bacterium]|nr:hypothetical protein [Candidatus Dormibacteraeota bacterium]
MTGPDLDQELGAIGRRLSPRLGAAHDAVLRRTTASSGARGRLPRLALPGRGHLGGAALTVAVGGAFAAALAVGVASPRVSPNTTVPYTGPSVALASSPGMPGWGTPAGGPGTPPAGAVVLGTGGTPTQGAAPTRLPSVMVSPTGPAAGGDANDHGNGPTPPPMTSTPPTAVSQPGPTEGPGAVPSSGSTPTHEPQGEQSPGPHAAPTAPPRFAATTTPTPAPPARIVLTQKDSGRTITIRPGDSVEVDLAGPTDGSRWTVPMSSDTTVLKSSSGSAKSNGSARAVFGTAGPKGSADIRATKAPACAYTTPHCPYAYRIDFQVTVVVQA